MPKPYARVGQMLTTPPQDAYSARAALARPSLLRSKLSIECFVIVLLTQKHYFADVDFFNFCVLVAMLQTYLMVLVLCYREHWFTLYGQYKLA